MWHYDRVRYLKGQKGHFRVKKVRFTVSGDPMKNLVTHSGYLRWFGLFLSLLPRLTSNLWSSKDLYAARFTNWQICQVPIRLSSKVSFAFQCQVKIWKWYSHFLTRKSYTLLNSALKDLRLTFITRQILHPFSSKNLRLWFHLKFLEQHLNILGCYFLRAI